MGAAVDFVNIAASQIGVKESPANSNNVKYGIWYGMNYEPWCDMFVSWCGNSINALDVVGKFAYCPYHVSYFKNLGRWLDREAQPQPGDVIFFANKGLACHVGIVERRNDASSVTTIEGNTSISSNDNGGAVMRRTRTYGTVGSSWYILGFGRPDWAKVDARNKPAVSEIYVPRGLKTTNFSSTAREQKFWVRGEIKDGKEIAIRNAANYLWMSDPGSSASPQTKVQFWDGANNNANPKDAQLFIVEETRKPGVVRLHPKVAKNLALDTSNGSTDANALIQLYTNNAQVAQEFYFDKVTSDQNDNLYRVISTCGWKPLTVY